MKSFRLKIIFIIIMIALALFIKSAIARAQDKIELPPVGPLIGWNVTPSHNIEARHIFGDAVIVISRRHKQPYRSSPDCQRYRDDGETIYYSTERIVYPTFRKPLSWHIEDMNGRVCSSFDSVKLICQKWK